MANTGRPTYQQYHTDVPLTNVSIAYTPGEYIAQGIFPAVPVQKQSDKYFTYDKGDWLRNDVGVRAPGGLAPIVSGYGLSTTTYACTERALGVRVPQEQVDNSDNPLRPLEDGTRFATEKVFLNMEIDVQAIAFGTTWSSSATPSVLWGNDTSDPLGDIESAACGVRLSIGQPAMNAVMGYEVWAKLKNHPDVVDRIKGAAGPGNPAAVTLAAVSALADLSTVQVGVCLQNTGAEGAANVIAPVWGKHFLVYYRPSTPSLLTPSAGYVFIYQTRRIERFVEERRRATVIECLWSYDSRQVSADAAYLLKSVVS